MLNKKLAQVFKSFIFSTILLFLSQSVFAIQSYQKLWGLMTYTNRQHALYYMLEPQVRLINRSGTYEQSLLNLGIGRPINPEIQLWFGQTYSNFSTSNTIGDDTNRKVSNEYRVWEQVLWNHQKDNYQFELRSRLEERHALEVAPWAIRWRNRLLCILPIYGPYSILTSDEFFLNLRRAKWITTKTFDQNRAYIGVLKQLNENTKVSLGYMNQYLTRSSAEDDHTLVINIIFQV